jgi:hypothetical protein
MRVADRFVDRGHLVRAIQCLRGLARLHEERERPSGEYPLGVDRGAPQIEERALEVAGLKEVMREILDVRIAAGAIVGPRAIRHAVELLQGFADALVQAPAADRV